MSKFIPLAAAIAMSLSFQASAQNVVVELFTSQGCSSCPPADEILGQIAEREDVIALSLHVDYWDYLGWTDEFADPAHTTRQRGYARAAHSTMIYTPQMVVGGVDHIVGTKAIKLADQIARHQAAAKPVTVSITRQGDALSIAATRVSGNISDMHVQLVRYAPQRTVAIRSGENAGREMTYHNVVESWETLGSWDGKAPLSLSHKISGDSPCVVIIQDGASGPILAAARID